MHFFKNGHGQQIQKCSFLKEKPPEAQREWQSEAFKNVYIYIYIYIYIKIREICIYKNIRVFIQDFGILTQFFALIYSIFWSGRPPRTPPKIGVILEKTFFFRSVFRKTSFYPLFWPFHALSSSFSNSPRNFGPTILFRGLEVNI